MIFFLDSPIIELTSKKVEGGDATKHIFFPNSDLHNMHKKSLLDQDLIMKVRTSMTSQSWNFNLLGSDTFIQNPLSSLPTPKPADLNLLAVANGFPPYDRQHHNTFRKRR